MCNRPTFCPAAVEQALRRTEAPLLEVKQVAQWRLRAEVTDTDLCTHTHTRSPPAPSIPTHVGNQTFPYLEIRCCASSSFYRHWFWHSASDAHKSTALRVGKNNPQSKLKLSSDRITWWLHSLRSYGRLPPPCCLTTTKKGCRELFNIW